MKIGILFEATIQLVTIVIIKKKKRKWNIQKQSTNRINMGQFSQILLNINQRIKEIIYNYEFMQILQQKDLLGKKQ
ncbi:unnamed protein product [Paramecium sonneborni]|uniref:Uncharacterized protein n=1 Tax=Paramecium sonneborni TaxID=65129 RepID=A0A8S1NLV9_9CILI|nr:unnamed protein product [Paramecium sonneborni]